jgi:uncharacterized protein
MTSELKTRITEAVKDAMRAKDKDRLGVLRLIMSDIKRIEVDERVELDDTRVLAVLDKMVKQRRDSERQFAENNRQDLADKESFEIGVIQEFLPQQLSEDEVKALVASTAVELGLTSKADMGKLMAALKPKVQGRADMNLVSVAVKAQLN